MTYYHGSPVADLTELKPSLSEHGKPYIYFSTNPLVALLYAVKPVPKPFSYYPYGFNADGVLSYSEYFEDGFKKLYERKVGYLYECDNLKNAEQPTQINCAYTVATTVKINKATKIDDLYQYFMQQEKQGKFIIRPFDSISEKEMMFIMQDMKNTVELHNLSNCPNNPMTRFVKEHFPAAL